MKCLFFVLFIPLMSGKHTQIVNYEDCTILQGVYQLDNGEKWRLKATKQSLDDYFVLQCDETDCENDVDQITFRYFDCDNDNSNGIVVLCPEDSSGNVDLTFTNCGSNICDNIQGEHFKKVEFHRREKLVWTASYFCSDN